MISELGNKKGIVFNIVDNAMLIRDSTRPISGEALFHGFWYPYPLIGYPFNVTDLGVYPLDNFFIGFLPVKIVVPGVF